MAIYLINQQLRRSLLLNVNDILPEDLLSAITFIGIEPRSHGSCVGPRGVFPAIDQ